MSKRIPKYNSQEWKVKRQEILVRDNFSCTSCKATDRQLNVHHRYYVPRREVWNYPSWSLVTLCAQCHIAEHSTPWDIIPWEWLLAYLLPAKSLSFADPKITTEIHTLGFLLEDAEVSKQEIAEAIRDTLQKLLPQKQERIQTV